MRGLCCSLVLLSGCGAEVAQLATEPEPGLHALLTMGPDGTPDRVDFVYLPPSAASPRTAGPVLSVSSDVETFHRVHIADDSLRGVAVPLLRESTTLGEMAPVGELTLRIATAPAAPTIEGSHVLVPVPQSVSVSEGRTGNGLSTELGPADAAFQSVLDNLVIDVPRSADYESGRLAPAFAEPAIASRANIQSLHFVGAQAVLQTLGAIYVLPRSATETIDYMALPEETRRRSVILREALPGAGFVHAMTRLGTSGRFVAAINESDGFCFSGDHSNTVPHLVDLEVDENGWVATGTQSYSTHVALRRGDCVIDLEYDRLTGRIFALSAQGAIYEVDLATGVVGIEEFGRDGDEKLGLVISENPRHRFVVSSNNIIWAFDETRDEWQTRGVENDSIGAPLPLDVISRSVGEAGERFWFGTDRGLLLQWDPTDTLARIVPFPEELRNFGCGTEEGPFAARIAMIAFHDQELLLTSEECDGVVAISRRSGQASVFTPDGQVPKRSRIEHAMLTGFRSENGEQLIAGSEGRVYQLVRPVR